MPKGRGLTPHLINGKVICQTGQDVPEQRDENGVRFFDAEGFLRERLGCGNACHPEWYRRNEWADLKSDTFSVGNRGMAQSFGIRGSFPAFYCFNLLFAPGALTLCDRNVHFLHWMFPSFTCKGTIPADEYRPLMEASLSSPHQLKICDIKSRYPDLCGALAAQCNYLYFGTDYGTYRIGLPSFPPLFTIDVTLLDGKKVRCRFEESDKPWDMLKRLLEVSSAEQLGFQLEKMILLGMAEALYE